MLRSLMDDPTTEYGSQRLTFLVERAVIQIAGTVAIEEET
jgi:hypothetical protein